MASLTADEITRYRREGWVKPSFRLPEPQVRHMREALDDLIARNPGVRPEKLVSAHIEGDNGEGVRGSAAFLELARDPQLVDLVSGVIGEDVILWGCHVFCKPALEGYETPWHQDGHYWPIRPLATCTVWVALEESKIENGCLRVIPGSHIGEKLHEHLHEDRNDLTLNQRMAAGSFDESRAVDVQLEPGEMSLHDVYMVHGARANTSTRRRTAGGKPSVPASSSPQTGCMRITANSSSSRRPGFVSTASGTLSLPMSCSSAPIASARSRPGGTPRRSPSWTASSATRRVCCSVDASFSARRTISARTCGPSSASSAATSSAAARSPVSGCDGASR